MAPTCPIGNQGRRETLCKDMLHLPLLRIGTFFFFFLLNSLCLLNKLGIYSQEACLCVLLVVMGLLGRLMVLELLVVDCFDGAGGAEGGGRAGGMQSFFYQSIVRPIVPYDLNTIIAIYIYLYIHI